MPRLKVALLVLVLAALVPNGTAVATDTGTETGTIHKQPATEPLECDEGDITTGLGANHGFVHFNINGTDRLIVQVVVKSASANTTYDLYVSQGTGAGGPNCNDSAVTQSTISTNKQGNGTRHLNLAHAPNQCVIPMSDPGTCEFWVNIATQGTAEDAVPSELYRSRPVVISQSAP